MLGTKRAGAAASSLTAAYGTFQLMSWYVGPIFQARRSSDNALANFYAHADGSFWTTTDTSGQQLTNWLNGMTAYCQTWYDQSGNGRHATQASASLQPIIDYASTSMDFTANAGSAYFNLKSGTVPEVVAYTVTVNHDVINNPTGGWLGGGVATSNQANNFRRSSSQYVNYWWGNDYQAGTYAQGNTITFKYNGTSTIYLYTNGALTSSAVKGGGWSGQAGNEMLGNTVCTCDNPLNGKLYFLYVYHSALSDNSRTMIEAGAFGKLTMIQ